MHSWGSYFVHVPKKLGGIENKMLISDEQRKHKRFVPEGLAFVVFRPDFHKIGRINNISRSGLGCHYLCPVDEKNPAAEKCQMIDILISGDSFYISQIPCSPVYDNKEDNSYGSFMLDMINRQCGLKFGQLTKKQEEQINFFLENCTT